MENSSNAVIYNSFTGAAMELDKKFLGYLEDNNIEEQKIPDEQEKNLIEELETNGFLIDDFVDEVKILKYRNTKEKYNRETLSLTILPTYRCNLKCFYCYEDRNRIETMTPEIQERVLQYVSKLMIGVKNIQVCWFGGEPLMAWDIVFSMSEKLMKLAREKNCRYSAIMVSNGYLLDDDKIKRFTELGIDHIQITLDGTPALHSKRKGIKGDPEANFELILKNISMLIKAKVKVRIRINIDKKNINAVDELLNLLAKANLRDAFIYPAMIETYTKLCSNIENNCLHQEEFAKIEVWFNKLLLEKGLKRDLSEILPTLKGNYCIYDQINSFSIAPEGDVYKCWSTIGNREEAISDITERDDDLREKKKRIMQNIENMTWDPFARPECSKCKLLPVCMGGCPHQYKESGGNKSDCLTIENTIKENVINHVFSMKINKLFQS
jgi:uncharacterized protein